MNLEIFTLNFSYLSGFGQLGTPLAKKGGTRTPEKGETRNLMGKESKHDQVV